jgi:hypothetical protein
MSDSPHIFVIGRRTNQAAMSVHKREKDKKLNFLRCKLKKLPLYIVCRHSSGKSSFPVPDFSAPLLARVKMLLSCFLKRSS